MKTASDVTNAYPLIAIIRGVTPDTCIEVGQTLVDAGFDMIEVPLNSPEAIKSIGMLVEHFGTDEYFIGAGTVTTLDAAKAVVETGANLVVTPNCNVDVIKYCSENDCATFPGVVTPTEAFTALDSGATGLKFFPVSMVGLDGMKAMLSVLPKGTKCYPVGGINPSEASMEPYVSAGAAGFGLGSSLYKPNMSLAQIKANAEAFVATYNALV